MKVINLGVVGFLPGERIKAALRIAEAKVGGEEPIVVVSAQATPPIVSFSSAKLRARGLQQATSGLSCHPDRPEGVEIGPSLGQELRDILLGISLLGDCSPRTLDALLSIGERISTHIFAELLRRKGIPATAVDAGDLLVTDDNYGSANIYRGKSEERTKAYLKN